MMWISLEKSAAVCGNAVEKVQEKGAEASRRSRGRKERENSG
jgi:hypothetical protein